jgi:predicted peroxiredoxin
MSYGKCGSIPVNVGKYLAESAKCTHRSKIKEMDYEVCMYLTYNGNYGNTTEMEKHRKKKVKNGKHLQSS